MREQELELIDYLEVLWRWRLLIGVTMVVAVLAAAVAGMRLSVSYIATTTFDAGTPRDKQQEDSVRQITSDLQRKWEGTQVAVTVPAPGRLRLTASAASPPAAEQALQVAMRDARDTLGRHVEHEQERRTVLQHELEELRSQQSMLMAARSRSLERSDLPGTLLLQITSNELARTALRVEAIEEELARATPSLVETSVHVTPAQGMSLRLLIVVAVILGAAISIPLAFLFDYIRSTRGRRPVAPFAAGGESGFRG